MKTKKTIIKLCEMMLVISLFAHFTALANNDLQANNGDKTKQVSTGNKLIASIGLLTTNTVVNITDSNFVIDEGLSIEDLEIQLGEESEVSSSSLELNLSYFPLRMLELNFSAGIVNSETGVDVSVQGMPDINLPIFEDGLDFEFENESDTDGISYGAGLALYLPILFVDEKPILLRAGARFNVRDLENVETDSITANVNLIYPTRFWGRDIAVAFGVNYLEIQRVVDFSLQRRNTRIIGSVEQELEDPWSAIFSISTPINETYRLSYTATRNFQDSHAHLFRLSANF